MARNPLAEVFAEINAQARRAATRRPVARPVLAPPVSDEEAALLTAETLPESDLARAKQLADLGERGSQKSRGGISGNFGSAMAVSTATAAKGVGGLQASGILDYGNPLALLQVQSDDERAEVLTAVLQTPALVANPNGRMGQPVAVVNFGIGGSQDTVEVDWVNGAVIQVPASYLRVSGRVDFMDGGLHDPSLVMQLGAFVGRDPKTKTTPLTKSFYLTPSATPIAAAGGHVTIGVPPHATQARLLYVREASNPPPANIELQALNSTANPLEYSTTLDVSDTLQLVSTMATVNAGNGAGGFVRVVNNDPALPITSAWLVYTIEL